MGKIVSEIRLQELARNVAPCHCDECMAMCSRPCWPTPNEALDLMALGFAKSMMLDYYDDDVCIYVVSPALDGYGGRQAPSWHRGICVFQRFDYDCAIHHMKPLEGRLARHDAVHPCNVHESIAMLWDSDDGRAVVALWKEAVDW